MPQPLLLFDGVCNLCNKSVQFILRHDKKKVFRFASLQGKKGQEVLQQFNLPQGSFNSLVLLDNGKVYTHSSAVLHMLRLLGGWWKVFYSFIIIPPFLRDPVYKLVAKNRYRWFGKREACWVPTLELKERFFE